MKKWLKALLCVVLALVLIVGGYVAYVFIDYHRLGDMALEVSNPQSGEMQPAKDYAIMTWNIGFGAYESDYGFFMDGGTESWAWSEERLDANMENIARELAAQEADLYIVQEVDRDATRSYHRDEVEPIVAALPDMGWIWAQNYDSPFLFYPFTQPHGKSVAGIMTLSPFAITDAQRYELPIEDSVMKLLDLDRCYSVSRIPVEGGHELVLYNFHLSAYTSDGTIANEQLELVLASMAAEYAKGNYVIGGGDFNKDILGDSHVYFGASDKEYTWAQPIPQEILDRHPELTLHAPLDEENPIPTCRNADGPYHQGQYVLTIDGFITSANVAMNDIHVVDTGFAYSDHNPVMMDFTLLAE